LTATDHSPPLAPTGQRRLTLTGATPIATDYTITDARYRRAGNYVAVACPSDNDFKSRAARLCCAIGAKYVGRYKAYVMTRKRADRFEKLHADGWDATSCTKRLLRPLPEPLQAGPWAECVKEATKDFAEAIRFAREPWPTCGYMRDSYRQAVESDPEQLAISRYNSWLRRASLQDKCTGWPLDKPSRDSWLAAGGTIDNPVAYSRFGG
jgi:hypothetical protein